MTLTLNVNPTTDWSDVRIRSSWKQFLLNQKSPKSKIQTGWFDQSHPINTTAKFQTSINENLGEVSISVSKFTIPRKLQLKFARIMQLFIFSGFRNAITPATINILLIPQKAFGSLHFPPLKTTSNPTLTIPRSNTPSPPMGPDPCTTGGGTCERRGKKDGW